MFLMGMQVDFYDGADSGVSPSIDIPKDMMRIASKGWKLLVSID